ncbi:MAG: glycosyltransferase family 25 protein [Holosporaceae bacterium]|jgi:glycosyl transferase family 25|nr:glycosyltransferase family 25 protein [Holosporaceae bacterium]
MNMVIALICLEAALLFFCGRIFRKSNNKNCENFRASNSGKIGVYLINLDRARERLDFVTPQILALDFPINRISAVDGSSLSSEEIESITDLKTYKRIFKTHPEVGTIGCSLSHEKTWRAFLESDNEFAIIFEDDVQFSPAKLREVIESTIEQKSLWDIVNFETKHWGCPVEISKVCHGRLVLYLTNVTHAGCYMINRRAAHRLLQKFYPIKMPLDHYFTSAWEFGLKFAGVEPRMVFQKFGNSQIKMPSDRKTKTISATNIIYNIQRAILHFGYNLLRLIIQKRFKSRLSRFSYRIR